MNEIYCPGVCEAVTGDELCAPLTAGLDAMDPETRAANCRGAIDDLDS